MIVCSCNVISSGDIRDIVTGFLDEDEWQLITPGMVYHALEKRGRCCGCFPGVIAIIIDTTAAYHRDRATPEADIIRLTDRIREQHERAQELRRIARDGAGSRAA